jgi:hypothetical protein
MGELESPLVTEICDVARAIDDTTNLDHRLDPRRIPRRSVASRSLYPSRNDEEAKASAVHAPT